MCASTGAAAKVINANNAENAMRGKNMPHPSLSVCASEYVAHTKGSGVKITYKLNGLA